MLHSFGTDGVRGIANIDLTAADALGLSLAAAAVLTQPPSPQEPSATSAHHRPKALIGRDTRPSGHMLEAAVTAGLTAAGVDVITAGVIPTPAVSYLTDLWNCDMGVMISASHNPMPDNGIKFFGARGVKLDETIERRIEEIWHRQGTLAPQISGADLGTVTTHTAAAAEYANYLSAVWEELTDNSLPPGFSFSSLTVVLDCSNGAASNVAPQILASTGVHVIPIYTDTSGININDNCGSTHIHELAAHVKQFNADLGIALDGDADRCIAVDAHGEPVDGDFILAVLGKYLAQHNKLHDNTIVATVMSNHGLHHALAEHNIQVKTTAVGDKYVLDEMLAHNYSLGGEQSGHIILGNWAKTGDGTLTALALIAQLAHVPSTSFLQHMNKLPQVLINVPVKDKEKILSSPMMTQELAQVNSTLIGKGRVLLRASGTEQLIRVMVESTDPQEAQKIAEHLAQRIASQ